MLSGNRNFEGRVSPDVQANYLASPPLVVAYALAGSVTNDLTTEPLGHDKDGKPVFLQDIWPTSKEIDDFIAENVTREMFGSATPTSSRATRTGARSKAPAAETYNWDMGSTYVQNPPYFEGMTKTPEPIDDIDDARILGLFGDKITTDHISPAGSIKVGFARRQVPRRAPGARRRLQPVRHAARQPRSHDARHLRQHPHQELHAARCRRQRSGRRHTRSTIRRARQMSIYDAAMKYQAENVPLVIFAGIEYGNGSSRDWAAKGTQPARRPRRHRADRFERIHRSNLVGMGVLPLVFEEGTSWALAQPEGRRDRHDRRPRRKVEAAPEDGSRDHLCRRQVKNVPLLCRIDTLDELEYFKNGGILQYVICQLVAA